MQGISIVPVPGFPVITGPTDLAGAILDSLTRASIALREGDVLVVAQKVVSKAEGRTVDLREVTPSQEATRIAAECSKDPRLVEVILRESREVVRARGPHLIVETHHGYVCANAGVDRSNVSPDRNVVCLLPRDPEASARTIRAAILAKLGVRVAVLVIDTHGRPFRNGAVGVCLGCAGIEPLAVLVGRADLFGYVMRSSVEAVADELAAAATLVMGQCDEGVPVVVIRGLRYEPVEEPGTQLVMPRSSDLFR